MLHNLKIDILYNKNYFSNLNFKQKKNEKEKSLNFK